MLKIISLLLLLISCNAQAAQAVDHNARQASEHITAQTVVQHIAPSIEHARALIERGLDNKAIGVLGQLLQTRPDNFQAWFLLGVTQAKQRRFHDAITSFGKVVALQPALAEPHNNLAVIYNELGDFRAAVTELEASLQLKPDYATAHENIGDLYVKLAADAYRKALQEDDRPALRQRYERLLHIRQPDQAGHQSAVVSETRVPPTGASDTAPQSPAAAGPVAKPVEQAVAVQQQPATAPAVALNTAKQHIVPQHNSAVRPAPVAASQRPVIQDDMQAAMAALEAWRSAWNRQDIPAYFASYSDDFDVGSRFKSLEQWKQYKQWVIKKRAFIRVTLENIKANPLPNGEIKLVFLQHFRSDSFNSDDIKTILLKPSQHGWKIVYEASQ